MNGTTPDFALDGRFFVRELQAGAQYATYMTGPTGPLYRRDATGATLRWYVDDGLGSVLGEVDASGNLDATRTYDVYGLARSSTGTATSKHGWVGNLGHTSEPETGLVYMRARYMDPVVGRFISEDPSLQGGNWFSYCGANPVGSADLAGKDGIDIGLILRIVMAAVSAPLAERFFIANTLRAMASQARILGKMLRRTGSMNMAAGQEDMAIADGMPTDSPAAMAAAQALYTAGAALDVMGSNQLAQGAALDIVAGELDILANLIA